jgi:hypothetical protein
MAYGIVLVFEGVNEDDYWAVNDQLGITRDGAGDWPPGLVSHSSGATGDGGWFVAEVWSSKGDQEAFMAGRLGAALGTVGLPAPTQVIDGELANHQTPGA